jgi:hypothetical protein
VISNNVPGLRYSVMLPSSWLTRLLTSCDLLPPLKVVGFLLHRDVPVPLTGLTVSPQAFILSEGPSAREKC